MPHTPGSAARFHATSFSVGRHFSAPRGAASRPPEPGYRPQFQRRLRVPEPGDRRLWGGSLEIANSVIRGAEGVAIGGIESEEATELLVTDTHVLDTKGPAIQNWSNVTIRRSEIAGSYLSSEAEGAAVVGVYGDVGSLSLATSALFGNVIEGSSLDPNPSPPVSASRPALVSGRVTQVERVLVAANVLGANASLFRVAVPDEPRMLEQDNTIALPNGPWMSNSVVARNLRIAADGEDWDLSPEDRDSSPVSNWSDNEAVGCSNLDPIHPYFHRTPALESSVSGSGALLEFESPSSAPDHPGLTLQRNFFVGNKLGASPLLRIDGAIDGLSIQLLHNTIADNGSASFLTLDNARSDARLTALKNLFAASETVAAPDRLLGTSAPIRSLISSMNAADNASIWSVADGDAETLLDGPHPTYTHPDFEPACDLQEMDDCERYQRICPSADTTDCSDQAWPELPCALDDAAGWVPTDGLLAQLGGPWPWETNFYADLRPQAAAPGATGGPCAPSRATFDSLTLHEGPWGDGDGYPDALDCDNSDPNRGSVVPAQDGYNSWFCTGAGGDCYACPEGSEPPPTADAQPTNSEAEAVEEPTAQDNTQFTSSSYLVDSGCSSGGCGVSYGCADSAAGAALPLLLFPLGWRRRRQNQ